MADKIRLDTKYDLKGDYVPSESEDELSEDDRRLLQRTRAASLSDSEQEVLGFSASEDEEDPAMADSDVEGKEEQDTDIPDVRAWGKTKRSFYSTGYVDQDYGGLGAEEEAAVQEETEARLLQNRQAELLGDEDFALDFFSSKKIADEEETIIETDLTRMSKRDKLRLMEKESPEFSGLVEDFTGKMKLVNDVLRPIIKAVDEGKLPECTAVQFIRTECNIIMNYCTNISFYIMLKAKKISIRNHPVIERLFKYRQLLNKLQPVYDEAIAPQVEKILEALCNGENLMPQTKVQLNGKAKKRSAGKNKASAKKLKLLSGLHKEDEENVDSLDEEDEREHDDDDLVEQDEIGSETEMIDAPPLEEQIDGDIDGTPGEKRAITYQMSKNKGLTPHRKKEQRNPRVKHRNKYRKAQQRRKGAIRAPRTELQRYAGELSGIKSNVKKSIKIK